MTVWNLSNIDLELFLFLLLRTLFSCLILSTFHFSDPSQSDMQSPPTPLPSKSGQKLFNGSETYARKCHQNWSLKKIVQTFCFKEALPFWTSQFRGGFRLPHPYRRLRPDSGCFRIETQDNWFFSSIGNILDQIKKIFVSQISTLFLS